MDEDTSARILSTLLRAQGPHYPHVILTTALRRGVTLHPLLSALEFRLAGYLGEQEGSCEQHGVSGMPGHPFFPRAVPEGFLCEDL